MISTRSAGLLIDTVVCLTLAKWETVSGRFGGYLSDGYPHERRNLATQKFQRRDKPTRFCATTCPSLTRRTTIFWRNFYSLQCASTPSPDSLASKQGNPL